MPDQAKEKITAAALVIEDIHNHAGIEKVGGHLPVETLTGPLITLFAKMLHPAGGAALEFGVILVFPGSGEILQSRDLLKAAQLFLCGLSKKLTAAAFADQAIDLGYQHFGNDDMGSSRAHYKSHLRLTTCGTFWN